MEQIIINYNTDCYSVVDSFVSSICDEYHIYNYYASIQIAVISAVENAFTCANNNDHDKSVILSCRRCNKGIRFSVINTHCNIDIDSSLGRIGSNENNHNLFLLKTLTDFMEFRQNGHELVLDFYVRGISTSVAQHRAKLISSFEDIRKSVLVDNVSSKCEFPII